MISGDVNQGGRDDRAGDELEGLDAGSAHAAGRRSNGEESRRSESRGGSASRQFPGVGDLAAANRPNLGSLDGRDGSGVPVQGGELHLEGLAVLVDMNHGS